VVGKETLARRTLATRLARHLTEASAVKLVQFHPSCTYEDFFEGYRPAPGASGTLTFTLRPARSARSRRRPARTPPEPNPPPPRVSG